ncbi:MAG: methyltransferase domain-containing protein [Desulfobacteraceae bacterium]|nr:methyltransferase domain-containing protein [Desulfobacteraceae bacterium]
MIKDPDKIIMRLILSLIDNKNFHILDVGCGDGKITEAISEKSKFTAGIEPFLSRFGKINTQKKSRLFYAANSGTKLCFKNKSFDMVIFCQSLHHIDKNSQKKAIEEAQRVLKNKGILLIIEPMYNKGLYGEITALINTEKELKENADKEIKSLNKTGFQKNFYKSLKIEFLIDDYNDFFNSKIKNKSGINWNRDIEIKVKDILSRASINKNNKFILDNYLNVFCFQKTMDV